MFYCDECARKNGWPDGFWLHRSRGPCEWCGKLAPCFDVRSDLLPDPPPTERYDAALWRTAAGPLYHEDDSETAPTGDEAS